jgi:PPM family protein phosphatase
MPLMLQPAVRTEVGRRANNEDAVFATRRLAAVADGVGGLAAGEVASQTVIGVLHALEKSRLAGRLEDALAEAVALGNDRIGFVAGCRPQLAGMSTTLTVVALADGGGYAIANVGDSRTYLLRDGALARLTRDDSVVQELIDGGALTEAESRRHPQRSVVLAALDGAPRALAAVATQPARAGDRLLLCSDGLSDVLPDDALRATLAGVRDARACAERLVDEALAAGARDNVTVVVADVVEQPDAPSLWPPFVP